jgi:hypothetical protein
MAFGAKRLAKDPNSFKDLVRWLLGETPRSAMAIDLIREMTSESLQSKEQLES